MRPLVIALALFLDWSTARAEDAVEAILERVERGALYVHDARLELDALGAVAGPRLVQELAQDDCAVRILCAGVLADIQFTGAIPALRAAGAQPDTCGRPEVLAALARLGDGSVAGEFLRTARDAAEDSVARRAALASLAAVGAPAALAEVRRFLPRPQSKPRRWFDAPSPNEEHQSVAWLDDSRLGGDSDIWVAVRDKSGKLGPARFVGGSRHCITSGCRPALRGDAVELWTDNEFEGEESIRPFLSVSLADLARDRDGDGLTDLVERRIHADPRDTDTDHDGLLDSEDLTPNGSVEPGGSEQEIAVAIFAFFSAFESPAMRLVVVDYDTPLRWPALGGPVITLCGGELEALLDDVGEYWQGGILPISFQREDEQPRPDEIRYHVYWGGSWDVAVRFLGGRWYVTDAAELPFE